MKTNIAIELTEDVARVLREKCNWHVTASDERRFRSFLRDHRAVQSGNAPNPLIFSN
jgi:hypothetical protein